MPLRCFSYCGATVHDAVILLHDVHQQRSTRSSPTPSALCENGLPQQHSAMTPNAHLPCHAQRAADVRPPTVRCGFVRHRADCNTRSMIRRSLEATWEPSYRGFDVLFSAGMRRARRPRRRPTVRSVHRASLTARACASCPGPAIPTCAGSHSVEARLRPSHSTPASAHRGVLRPIATPARQSH